MYFSLFLVDEFVCSFLGVSSCILKVDPEIYGSCGLYDKFLILFKHWFTFQWIKAVTQIIRRGRFFYLAEIILPILVLLFDKLL